MEDTHTHTQGEGGREGGRQGGRERERISLYLFHLLGHIPNSLSGPGQRKTASQEPSLCLPGWGTRTLIVRTITSRVRNQNQEWSLDFNLWNYSVRYRHLNWYLHWQTTDPSSRTSLFVNIHIFFFLVMYLGIEFPGYYIMNIQISDN